MDGVNTNAMILLIVTILGGGFYFKTLLDAGRYTPPTLNERMTMDASTRIASIVQSKSTGVFFPTHTPVSTRVNIRLAQTETAVSLGRVDPAGSSVTATATPYPTVTPPPTMTLRPSCGRVEYPVFAVGDVVRVDVGRYGALRLLGSPRTDNSTHDRDVLRLVYDKQVLWITGAGVCGMWAGMDVMYYPVKSNYWIADNAGWIGAGSYSTPWLVTK